MCRLHTESDPQDVYKRQGQRDASLWNPIVVDAAIWLVRENACRCLGWYLSVLRGTGGRDSFCSWSDGGSIVRSLFARVKPDKAARCFLKAEIVSLS